MAHEWEVTTERLVSSANVIEEKTAKYNSEWAKLEIFSVAGCCK